MNDLSEIIECLGNLVTDCAQTAQNEEEEAVNCFKTFLESCQEGKHVAAPQNCAEASGIFKNSEIAKHSDSSERKPKESPSSCSSSNVFGSKPTHMQELIEKLPSKKRKFSTLEKSSMDWERFKAEEDLSSELEMHNKGKDGYLNRQAFLQRCDVRTFEQERTVRLSNRKQ